MLFSSPQTKWKLLVVGFAFSSMGLSSELAVTQKSISFSEKRKMLTLEYIRQRYDPKATSIKIKPIMIVIHWTASTNLLGTWNHFNNEVLSGRPDIIKYGKVNTSAHYLVDRDGEIFQLMPENIMARHVIGLNRKAIGIENIGSRDSPLTPAQLEANLFLVQKISKRHNIKFLIGHFEYGRFRNSKFWEERDPKYFTIKDDPGIEFMKNLRSELIKVDSKFFDKP